MFKKLLSNLPFNPSLIGQVAFYSKRLHRESALRRSGFIVMVLALVLQMFAVVSPPESSLRANPSVDLISGGFSSKGEAVDFCKKDVRDYKKIVNHFGITCEDLADSKVIDLDPHAHNDRLYSMGRMAFGDVGETPIHIPGAGTVYSRKFTNHNKQNSYKALSGTTKYGMKFYVLFACGNLVTIGVPHPPVDVCSNIKGIQTKPEDCDVCPNVKGIQKKKSECDVCANTPGEQSSPSQCDDCPKKPGVQTNNNCDVCPNKPGTQTTHNECDVCSNIDGIQTDKADCDVCDNIDGIQLKESDCDVCSNIPGQQSSTNECKSCEESQTREDLTSCLEYKKTASNITQNINDANNTTAKANDVIEYKLTTTNKGKVTIKGFAVTENINDVLDYADITDLHGATRDNENILSWPKQDIKPGQTLTNLITIKVKPVIPSTPVGASDPHQFDLTMTNFYGNAVDIKLPGSTTKTVEVATTKLPNTGPGTSLAIAATVTIIFGYFFARSRLLAHELDIIRTDFGVSAGGY